MDYLCVPQGQKDAREQDFFQFTLDNIKMLYLSGQVVIFVDQKYMGRFWTQYEAFLSLHKATRNGILPKTLENCAAVPMPSAAPRSAPPASSGINES